MVYDPSGRDLSSLNIGRMMRAESDVILPMLQTQREDAIAAACQAFRTGQMNDIPIHIARLVTVENMCIEIKQKIAKAEAIEKRIYDADRSPPIDY